MFHDMTDGTGQVEWGRRLGGSWVCYAVRDGQDAEC